MTHSPDDWQPSCRCDPPCILQRLAAMSRGQLLDYAVEVGGSLEMYQADEADRIAWRQLPWYRRLLNRRWD